MMKIVYFLILSLVLTTSSARFCDKLEDIENMVIDQITFTEKTNKFTSIIKELEDMVLANSSVSPTPLINPTANYNITDIQKHIDKPISSTPLLLKLIKFLKMSIKELLSMQFEVVFGLLNKLCKLT